MLAGALLGTGACGPSAPASAPVADRLALHPCVLVRLREIARCGAFRVFENRTLGSGRSLDLRVVILKARRAPVDQVPVVLLTGGPGLGAAETMGYAAFVLAGVRERRNIVLVDQRGTGRSHPLECDLYGGGHRLQALFDPMFPVEPVRRCRDALARRADLTQYATTPAIEDLDDLRATLGADRVDLFGVSYGTRVAQEYLRRHPDRVRRIALQGVIDPTSPVMADARLGTTRAFDHAVAACAADPACHAAAPDPAADLRALTTPAGREPARVRIWSWRTLAREPVVLHPRAVAERVWTMLYDAGEWRTLLPLMHRAASGDPTPFVERVVRRSASRKRGRSEGMMLSVLCSEDAPRYASAMAEDTSGLPLGIPVAAELAAACEGWPRVAPPKDFTTLVASDVPTLLISGAFDPVAPPELAGHVASAMPRAVHLVHPRGGHADFDSCVQHVVGLFFTLSVAEAFPASTCLPRWAPTPSPQRGTNTLRRRFSS